MKTYLNYYERETYIYRLLHKTLSNRISCLKWLVLPQILFYIPNKLSLISFLDDEFYYALSVKLKEDFVFYCQFCYDLCGGYVQKIKVFFRYFFQKLDDVLKYNESQYVFFYNLYSQELYHLASCCFSFLSDFFYPSDTYQYNAKFFNKNQAGNLFTRSLTN